MLSIVASSMWNFVADGVLSFIHPNCPDARRGDAVGAKTIAATRSARTAFIDAPFTRKRFTTKDTEYTEKNSGPLRAEDAEATECIDAAPRSSGLLRRPAAS